MPMQFGTQPTSQGGFPPNPGSIEVNRFSGRGRPTPPPDPISQAYGAYGGAVNQQAGDYDDIMQRYRSLLDKDLPAAQTQLQDLVTKSGTTAIPDYQSTQDYQKALANQKGLAETGGYSQEDIANIRERGISPIRSVYQNAQQNLQRQRSLQGGYSPNYGAVSAKMAREMSSQLSDQTTAVNAGIAQNVAQNRLAASTPYLSTAAGEQESRNAYALKKGELGINQVANLTSQFAIPIQGKASALSGMTGLYGTTPAFANMMGNQANTQAGLQQNARQNNRTQSLNTARMGLPGSVGSFG